MCLPEAVLDMLLNRALVTCGCEPCPRVGDGWELCVGEGGGDHRVWFSGDCDDLSGDFEKCDRSKLLEKLDKSKLRE
jgi:hypothetical protein